MTRRFIVRPLAEADLEDAARWYGTNEQVSPNDSSAMSIARSDASANDHSSSPRCLATFVERAAHVSVRCFISECWTRSSSSSRYCTSEEIRRCGEDERDRRLDLRLLRRAQTTSRVRALRVPSFGRHLERRAVSSLPQGGSTSPVLRGRRTRTRVGRRFELDGSSLSASIAESRERTSPGGCEGLGPSWRDLGFPDGGEDE